MIKAASRPPKAAEMIDYVAANIATQAYLPGHRIPSIRRLAIKFGISYGTASRGIDYLTDSGVLIKDGTHGFAVAGRRPATPEFKRITVFMEPFIAEREIGMCHTAFMQMQELAYRNNCHFVVVPIRGEELTAELIRKASAGSHGIVMLNEYDTYFSELETDLPVVGTLMNSSFGGRISTVNIDPFDAACRAAAYFRERKIKHVTIVSFNHPVYRRRGEFFQLQWEREGGCCEWNFDLFKPWRIAPDHGIFFTSDQIAENHIRTMEADDVDLTAYPVISVDGKRTLASDFHRFPTVAGNWKQIGQAIFWEIFNRIRYPGYPVRHILIEGVLIPV
ncbi:MAG: hypothetical protein AB7F32_09855 [Victivallaceae bacterium]